jgi:hypothetical protein
VARLPKGGERNEPVDDTHSHRPSILASTPSHRQCRLWLAPSHWRWWSLSGIGEEEENKEEVFPPYRNEETPSSECTHTSDDFIG